MSGVSLTRRSALSRKPNIPFTPLIVAGLRHWHKADAITGKVDGDALSQWDDSSGNARHMTQATGANQPTYKTGIVNSLPVVRFDGVNDRFNVPAMNTMTAGTVFLVVKVTADPAINDSTDGLWVMDGAGAAANRFPYTDGKIYDGWGTTTNNRVVGDPTPSLASWNVYEVQSGSALWEARLNGTVLFTTATNTVSFGPSPVFGASAGAAQFLSGDVAELVIYDSVLGSSDRSSVRSYLGTKYGITVI